MAKLWQFGRNKLRRLFWRSHKHAMAFLPNSSLIWPISRSEFSIFSSFHLWCLMGTNSYEGDMFFHDTNGSLGFDYIQPVKKLCLAYISIFSHILVVYVLLLSCHMARLDNTQAHGPRQNTSTKYKNKLKHCVKPRFKQCSRTQFFP
jgi:hypothetical protein